jgi:ribosomal protein L13
MGPDGSTDWISLPPNEDETRDQWWERGEIYRERIERLIAHAWKDMLPYAQTAVAEQERVAAFQRDELPAIRDALRLIQIRESPRQRHRCETC